MLIEERYRNICDKAKSSSSTVHHHNPIETQLLKMSLRAKLHLKKESQSNLAPALQQLRQSGELLDVTLVSDDGTAVEAHRLVLSASSPVFRAMLGRHSQTQAIVFLPGTSSSHLTSILDFLYTGETTIQHEQVADFLGLAEKFSIKDLGEQGFPKYEDQTDKEEGELESKSNILTKEKEIQKIAENIDNLENATFIPMSNDISVDEETFFHPDEVSNPRAMRSQCWNFYLFKGSKNGGPDKSKVYCRLCMKAQQFLSGKNGTSGLNKHIRNIHPNEWNSTTCNKG